MKAARARAVGPAGGKAGDASNASPVGLLTRSLTPPPPHYQQLSPLWEKGSSYHPHPPLFVPVCRS
jgi:hypothetical protein